MIARLAAFLDVAGQAAWAPATVNCCLVLADWAICLGRPDPAAHLRGTFANEAEFRAIVERAGGLVRVVGDCAGRIGGFPVERPQAGDVGVIGSAKRFDRQFGAIFDGSRWQVRFIDRFAPMTATPLGIWRV